MIGNLFKGNTKFWEILKIGWIDEFFTISPIYLDAPVDVL